MLMGISFSLLLSISLLTQQHRLMPYHAAADALRALIYFDFDCLICFHRAICLPASSAIEMLARRAYALHAAARRP